MPGLSVQTVTSKLRDAVRGAIAFAYCTEPSVEDLTNWWSKVIVRPEGEQVHIGPRTPLKETYTTESAAPKTGFVFDTLTAEETQAFALLLNNGRISGPITIRKPKHEPVLSALFNVDIVRLKNGHLQII